MGLRGVADPGAAQSRLWSRRPPGPARRCTTGCGSRRCRSASARSSRRWLPANAPGVYHVGGRYLVRRGAQNLPLTPRELLRMLHERGIAAYEDSPVPGATLADLDPARIAWYRERARRQPPLAA